MANAAEQCDLEWEMVFAKVPWRLGDPLEDLWVTIRDDTYCDWTVRFRETCWTPSLTPDLVGGQRRSLISELICYSLSVRGFNEWWHSAASCANSLLNLSLFDVFILLNKQPTKYLVKTSSDILPNARWQSPQCDDVHYYNKTQMEPSSKKKR